MLKYCFRLAACAILVLASVASSRAQSAPHPQWVGTWATAPFLAEGGFNARPLSGTTLREIAHISVGGSQVRLRFTNELGTDPLTISDAHVALSAGGAAIQSGTDHSITFGGASSFTIPPGAAIYSDPAPLAVQALSDVAVSFYLPPQFMRAETYHSSAQQDNFIANGDMPSAPDLPDATRMTSWYFFDGIDVPAVDGSRAIVAFGDSITDGAASARNANHRWPDFLAARLNQDPKLKDISVLNEGIGGNRVLNETTGPSALSRIDRDILAQNGVRYIIVLESINDINRLAHLATLSDNVTAQQLEFGLKQIADAAHQHGIKVIGATLTPSCAATCVFPPGEQVREAVNDWIRTSGTFDGVADFDKAARDPQNPTRFNPAYDSGDHLHPNDAGYNAMAGSIDLSLFAK
jgi:lysophospholipase L1-like esterase